jgi:hypothetical protein
MALSGWSELDFGVRADVVAGRAQSPEYLLAGGCIPRQLLIFFLPWSPLSSQARLNR